MPMKFMPAPDRGARVRFGVPQLRTMLPGLIAMKANTAVFLILIGIALWISLLMSLTYYPSLPDS
jgi:hypothetical protein